MAQAEPNIVEYEETVTRTKREGVVLTLTEEEAQALRDVTALMGGSSQVTRRKHVAAIGRSLTDLGFRYNTRDITGSIRFLSEADAAIHAKLREDEDDEW